MFVSQRPCNYNVNMKSMKKVLFRYLSVNRTKLELFLAITQEKKMHLLDPIVTTYISPPPLQFHYKSVCTFLGRGELVFCFL